MPAAVKPVSVTSRALPGAVHLLLVLAGAARPVAECTCEAAISKDAGSAHFWLLASTVLHRTTVLALQEGHVL